MNALAQFARILSLCIACVSILAARAATTAPDKRDGQVLDALLLHLLSDSKFDMTRVSTNGATIILHARTPEKTGFIQPPQMGSDKWVVKWHYIAWYA